MKNLTMKSRKIIILSAIISILLIVTIGILYIQMLNNNTINKERQVLLLIVAVLVIASFIVVIYKRINKDEYTKELNSEYYEKYEGIKDIIIDSNLVKSEKKEALSDIASMLYHARNEERDIDEVVGNDINVFSDRVINSFGYRNGLLFYLINGVTHLIIILSLLQVINFVSDKQYKTFFESEMAISIIPYMVALSFLIVPLLRKTVSKKNSTWTFIVPIVFIVVYVITHEVLHKLNLDIVWLDNYLNGYVTIIKSWWVLILVLLGLGLSYFLKRYLRSKSINNL